MVSFVILEYHSISEIDVCLRSIQQHISDIPYEVVVSSNSQYSVEKQTEVKHTFSNCKWIFNSGNLGFAGGMNEGLKAIASDSDYVVIMNQDVSIKSNTFGELTAYLTSHPEVGMLGVRIRDAQGKIQDSFRKFYTPLSIVFRQLKRFFKRSTVQVEYRVGTDPIQVDWVIGAFMLLRRDVLTKVGLLDSNFFLYVEDMEWCYRVNKSGYKIMYYPGFEIEYAGDRKSLNVLKGGWKPNKYLFFHIKSYLYFLRKHRLFFKF